MAADIQVMIVDDSRLIRTLLTDIIEAEPDISIQSEARDGSEALRKISRAKPDVVILDLEMPRMDGLTFLENIMERDPIPVIVNSSYAQGSSQLIFDALDLGAVDFISRSENEEGINLTALPSKIRSASDTYPRRMEYRRKAAASKRPQPFANKIKGSIPKIVIIGASTGGPRVIGKILSELPGSLPAGIAVVQHLPAGYTTSFAQHLDKLSPLEVREAKDGDEISPGTALVAPGGFHLTFGKKGTVSLDDSPPRLGSKPSINMSMVSAAEVYGPGTIGVLLSGMGHDGAFGLKTIQNRGGRTVGQDEASSLIFGMASSAEEVNAVQKLVHLDSIPSEIIKAVRQ